MSAYVIASVVLVVYFFAQKKITKRTFSTKYVCITACLTYAAVLFRDLIFPVLVLPVLLPVVSTILAGNLAELLEGLYNKALAYVKSLL